MIKKLKEKKAGSRKWGKNTHNDDHGDDVDAHHDDADDNWKEQSPAFIFII